MNRRAFTLVEVVTALFIAAVAIMGTMTLLGVTWREGESAKRQNAAGMLAPEAVAAARQVLQKPLKPPTDDEPDLNKKWIWERPTVIFGDWWNIQPEGGNHWICPAPADSSELMAEGYRWDIRLDKDKRADMDPNYTNMYKVTVRVYKLDNANDDHSERTYIGYFTTLLWDRTP